MQPTSPGQPRAFRGLLFAAALSFAWVAARAQSSPPADTVRIGAVQGDGERSPLVGQRVRVVGVVTGDFQGDGRVGLGGFFLQEEDDDVDGDPATSEGVWVFQGDRGVAVAPGQVAVVSGEVSEFGDLTQIDVRVDGGAVEVVGEAALPEPVTLDLAGPEPQDYERVEGMRVAIGGQPIVTAVADLDRFGSITLAGGGRLAEFTECNAPSVSGLRRYDSLAAARSLVVDDGRGAQDLPPRLGGYELTAEDGLLRAGNEAEGLIGVLDERFTGYRIQVTELGGFRTANPRPTARPDVGGDLVIAGVNVLNYFNGDGEGGGFPTERGARTAEAFARQEAKLVRALCELEADVLGLVEVENDGYGPRSSVRSLTDAIADRCGLEYGVVEVADVGTDDIRVAVIYRTAVVESVGTPRSLDDPAATFRLNRVPLAASFRVVQEDNPSLGEVFTVAVNHFRSKGGDCRDTDIPGDDAADGSGACDGTRTAAAEAVAEWLAADPTGVNDDDYLVLGDLNAYRRERPITTFTGAGYVDAVAERRPGSAFPCGGAATYVYRGRWGALDHALASESLAPQVVGADVWHVNAAEPDALAYWNDALATSDYYRFSDHDPVVVGLSLRTERPTGAVAGAAATTVPLERIGPRAFAFAGYDPRASYQVIDSLGRLLPVQLDPDGRFELPAGLPGGGYFLRERTRRGAVSAHKFVAP